MLAFTAVGRARFIHIGGTICADAEVIKKIVSIAMPGWWQSLATYLDFNIAVSSSVMPLLTITYTATGGFKPENQANIGIGAVEEEKM
jgi:hypothetical protein